MKIRLSDARPVCAHVLGYTATDLRTAGVINRVTERLLHGGKWKGTMIRYRVCVNQSCLVLPRQIETVEAWWTECAPGTVRNHWWEFLSGGPGMQCPSGCFSGDLIMNNPQDVASFDNVTGTGKKLAIYANTTEATGAYVTLRYYDSNGQWVRTQDNVDGEQLAIPASGAYTISTYECMPGGFSAAIKPVTKRPIHLYEYTVSTGTLKPLAYWEPDEVIPQYRSVLIPGMTASAQNGSSCEKKTVVIQGKARFAPALNDDDFLQVESIEAIRLGCQAVAKEEKDLLGEAASYWQMAFRVLDAQLSHYNGAGAQQPIQIINAGVPGNTVMNLV